MKNEITEEWPKGCRLLPLPEAADERGTLAFLEGGVQIPFPVKRVFWIYGVPDGKTRGGHAHDTCAEAIFPVAGAFTIELDDGCRRRRVRMNKPNVGVLVPAGIWCNLTDFAPETVCVVAASHPYDAQGYINRYEDYVKRRRP